MVWDPSRITPRPWANLIAFYRDIEDRNLEFRPIRILAEHVAARSPRALFGASSGTALLVARREGADWAREGVRVDVGLDGRIRFVMAAPAPAKPRVSTSEASAIVNAFEELVHKAGWGARTMPDRA